MDLVQLQDEMHEWRQGKFRSTSSSGHMMLGVVEEVGELAHSLLKQDQEIRGDWGEHEANAKDAVGDIVIFLMGLCSAKHWSFDQILTVTAQRVMARDWVADPLSGGEDEDR